MITFRQLAIYNLLAHYFPTHKATLEPLVPHFMDTLSRNLSLAYDGIPTYHRPIPRDVDVYKGYAKLKPAQLEAIFYSDNFLVHALVYLDKHCKLLPTPAEPLSSVFYNLLISSFLHASKFAPSQADFSVDIVDFVEGLIDYKVYDSNHNLDEASTDQNYQKYLSFLRELELQHLNILNFESYVANTADTVATLKRAQLSQSHIDAMLKGFAKASTAPLAPMLSSNLPPPQKLTIPNPPFPHKQLAPLAQPVVGMKRSAFMAFKPAEPAGPLTKVGLFAKQAAQAMLPKRNIKELHLDPPVLDLTTLKP